MAGRGESRSQQSWLIGIFHTLVAAGLTLGFAAACCAQRSLQEASPAKHSADKLGASTGWKLPERIRKQMVGQEIPYRGPFRLPDGRIAMPRCRHSPSSQGAVSGKAPSGLPFIWGLDGRAAGPAGPARVIVAKVAFTDFNSPEVPRGDLEEWFFNTEPGGYPDSLAEYYDRESFGQLVVSGSVLPETGSYQLDGMFIEFLFPMNPTKYAQMWASLVSQIDEDVDGSDYDGNGDGAIDAIIVIPPDGDYAGVGGPLAFVDNHAVSGMYSGQIDGRDVETYGIQSNVFGHPLHRYAVPWHEFGHILGLPDLYDGGGMGPGTPGPDGDEGMGPGGWAVMAHSGDISYDLPMDAPMKLLLGWETPVELSTDPGTEHDVFMLYANETLGEIRKVLLRTGTLYLGSEPVDYEEYLLFEGRALMPPGMPVGMLAWHVNEEVYLRKVLGGAQPELPNTDEEHKYTDVIETPYNADSLVDRPYTGNPASLVRASDVWPYQDYNSIYPVVPTGVEYIYKHPSTLLAKPTAPYFDANGPQVYLSEIAVILDGIHFHYSVGIPPPPEIVSFEPHLVACGTGLSRSLRLTAAVAGNSATDSIRVAMDYFDAAGEPQRREYAAAGGSVGPIDLVPLMPNQRITLSAVASNAFAESEPVTAELDALTLVGDANCDDVLDDADVPVLRANFGLSEQDVDFRLWYDPNEDGVVDERDTAYIGYRFGCFRPGS